MSERDHNGTLYTVHICICKCIQYMSLYPRKPGVTSPTTKTLICTDVGSQDKRAHIREDKDGGDKEDRERER